VRRDETPAKCHPNRIDCVGLRPYNFHDESGALQEGQKARIDQDFLSQLVNSVLSHVYAIEAAKNPETKMQ